MPEELKLRPELVDSSAIVEWRKTSIETQADAETCGNYIKLCTERKKEIKFEADKVTKPLKTALNEFQAMVRKALGPVEDTERYLRRQLGQYWDAQQKRVDEEARKKREAEQRRLEAEAKKSKFEAMQYGSKEALEKANNLQAAAEREAHRKLQNKQTMKLSTGTIVQSTKYDWELVDVTKVPQEYYMLDEKKLNAIARGYKNNPIEVPGVKFVKKSIVGVR